MRIEIYRTLELNGEEKNIEFFCDYEILNDGIGNYEFWGSTGYDKGVDYLELNKVNWNTALYNESQNKSILDWVIQNWDGIEKEVESRHMELKQPDTDNN